VTRTAVVGLGLIGGSIALAAGAPGWDLDLGVRERARRRGLDARETLDEALAGAELVVVAVPTTATADILVELSRRGPDALLTDCASLKRPIVEAATHLREGIRFVAGHPMAGARGRGVEAADAGIFRGRPWAVVRTVRSDAPAIAELEDFVRSLGARPVAIDAARHDRAMTWASHLPLAVAAALARASGAGGGPDLATLAGPGWLDTTRLAGQPTSLALELASADPESLALAAESVASDLGALAAILRTGGQESLRRFFEEAEALRRSVES
jgi:prephenate dehydrogenase